MVTVTMDEVVRRVAAVADPELPILTLQQLGVVRAVEVDADRATVRVDLTPTYSGCPAMEVIAQDVADAVRECGLTPDIRLVLSPPWTTDWITEEGRKALLEAGIAPPAQRVNGPVTVSIARRPATPACPLCGAADVEELSRFGSTACKALWRCLSCREPFDYVKPL